MLLFQINSRIIRKVNVISIYSLKWIYQRVQCSLRSVFWFESKVIPQDFFHALHNGPSHSKRQYKKKKRRISGDLLQGTPRCLDWSRGKVIPNQLHHTLLLDRCCVHAHTCIQMYVHCIQTIKLGYFSAPHLEKMSFLLDYACFSDCRDSSVIHNCMVYRWRWL